jgi:hypothetical protein
MKTVKLYSGSDTYGVNYELAILEGKYYHRNMVFNGYGKGWGKWEAVTDFSGTFYTDQYGKDKLKWGWGMDAICLGECKRKINLTN